MDRKQGRHNYWIYKKSKFFKIQWSENVFIYISNCIQRYKSEKISAKRKKINVLFIGKTQIKLFPLNNLY